MKIKAAIYNLMYSVVEFRWNIAYQFSHRKELKQYRKAGFSFDKCGGETAFVEKWKSICRSPNVDYYRFYASFIGNNVNILPDDLFHKVIEPILNNQNALSLYSDKNLYDKLIDGKVFPKCLLRNIDGDFFDGQYRYLHMNVEMFRSMVLEKPEIVSNGRFIVKPSIDTCGGIGIRLFKRTEDNRWISNDGKFLSLETLLGLYNRNFIIQECIEPSNFVKQFNPESYNTFRVITYRSLVDDQPKLLGIYMRIGPKGSFKDNVHSGGFVCPISSNGILFQFAMDGQRKTHTIINGIDLEHSSFVVPNFQGIINLAFEVARKMTLQRLLSFDIILNQENQPRIIEINIKNQTITTIQTTTGPFFGDYTDEVLEYCQTNKDKICYESVFRNNN